MTSIDFINFIETIHRFDVMSNIAAVYRQRNRTHRIVNERMREFKILNQIFYAYCVQIVEHAEKKRNQ